MNIFLFILSDGAHHYVVADDFGKAWEKFVSMRPTIALSVNVIQKANESPVMGLTK